MGLSLAKYGEITFKNGRVQQKNFNDYKVARIDEGPVVTNVYIMPPGPETPPSGVGEPGVPPFAPALCNAIFAATGKRIRSLPIGKQVEFRLNMENRLRYFLRATGAALLVWGGAALADYNPPPAKGQIGNGPAVENPCRHRLPPQRPHA